MFLTLMKFFIGCNPLSNNKKKSRLRYQETAQIDNISGLTASRIHRSTVATICGCHTAAEFLRAVQQCKRSAVPHIFRGTRQANQREPRRFLLATNRSSSRPCHIRIVENLRGRNQRLYRQPSLSCLLLRSGQCTRRAGEDCNNRWTD